MFNRPQIQPYAQFLMGMATIVVTVAVLIAEPGRIGPAYILALVEVLSSCVIMAVVWRAQPTRGLEWLWLMPFADVVACIPIRDAAVEVIPSVGLLAIFPIAWLAFAFGTIPLVLGLVLTSAAPVTTLVRTGAALDDARAWAAVIVPSVLLALFALTVRFVANDIRHHRTRAHAADRRLAAALSASTRNTATLRELIQATPAAILVLDNDGAPLLANERAREAAERGRFPLDFSALHDSLVFGVDRVTPIDFSATIHDDLRAGVHSEPRLMWLGPPGDQVAVRTVARPVVADGEAIGVVVVAHDVTELADAVEVRDRFLDTVGHELRTPLTVIIGHADIAAALPDAADHHRWLAVQRAAERLDATVESLLASGRERVASLRGGCDVRDVVDRAVAETGTPERGVRIDVTGPNVRAGIGARELATIVAALVRNAVSASDDGGAVRVAITATGDTACITVDDDGRGLSADELRQVFDRFYRTARSRHAADQGVGLGLSIARQLAEAEDGELTLEPRRPRGIRARLELQSE